MPVAGVPGQDGLGLVLQGFLETEGKPQTLQDSARSKTTAELAAVSGDANRHPKTIGARPSLDARDVATKLLPRSVRIEFSIDAKNLTTEVTTATTDYRCDANTAQRTETGVPGSREVIDEEYALDVSGYVTPLEPEAQLFNVPDGSLGKRYLVKCEGSFKVNRLTTTQVNRNDEEIDSESVVNFSASVVVGDGEESVVVRHKSHKLVLRLHEQAEVNAHITNNPA